MCPAHAPLSRSAEDYLKAIYGLSERGEAASTSAIADALAVQPASVTGMVKRLAESELLEHVPYRGVRLTERGVREALKVLRRHRIIETYLCERLGYAWEDVHEEAERLEHAASDRLVEQMADALHFPSHDPHGAPIPTSSGEIEATDFATLADAASGVELRVRAVRDEDPRGLRSLEATGLTPGVRLLVEAAPANADGGVSVLVGGAGGARLTVAPDLARQIFVVPLSEGL
jgi:DtxR family Mn-dependent transcriptional regulator